MSFKQNLDNILIELESHKNKSNIYYFLNDEFYCDYKGSDTFSVSNSFGNYIIKPKYKLLV